MKSENQYINARGQSAARRHSFGLGILSAALVAFLAAVTLTMAEAAPDKSRRDPFWPLGYEPPKPESEKPPALLKPEPEKPKPPPEPEKPIIQPVTESEWDAAHKFLSISGQISSTRPDTGETHVQMMINRQTYAAGDIVCITNRDIVFVWQLESASAQDLQLKQMAATRLQADTKQTKKQ